MKILYGVCGEGLGHATRSMVVIQHLLEQNHEVQVVSSSRAFHFLLNAFPGRVHEIDGLSLVYKNTSVHRFFTFCRNLINLHNLTFRNFRKYRELRATFKPNLVISDLETFASLFALLQRLPIISVDNNQVFVRCRTGIKVPFKERLNYVIGKWVIRAKMLDCRKFIITTFVDFPKCNKSTLLVPPILREKVLNAPVGHGSHILVYQTSESQVDLVSILLGFPHETFYVYGLNREEEYRNVKIRLFSETRFIEDLASCKGVITNGGFTLISEAVYLRKPICTVPIGNQFEQFITGACVGQARFGLHLNRLTRSAVQAFLFNLTVYQDNLSKYHQNGNEEFFMAFDREIKSIQ
jgi:uncharacterized protein (TIGR00661 family)